MKKLIRPIVSAAALLGSLAVPALGADIGVSINVAEPGLFGQITLGNLPAPPPVIYAQPVVVAPVAGVVVAPIYLHVPPGHEREWARHCGEYHACGRPVYFVREDWYNREYAPRYARHEWHGDEGEHGHRDRDEDRDHGHDHGHEDR
jgi:hypothetical protein